LWKIKKKILGWQNLEVVVAAISSEKAGLKGISRKQAALLLGLFGVNVL